MEPRKIIMVLTAVLCLLVTGCALIGSGGTSTALDNTSWVLERLHDQTVMQGRQLTLNFAQSEINGSTGCNSYSGSYTGNDNGAWQIQQGLSVTEMACSPNQVMVQEGQFLGALQAATAYEIVDEKLTLKDGQGQALAVFAAPGQGLQGTSWLVTEYDSGTGLTSILPGSTVTATFGANGRVNGSAGCNNYFAAYTTSASSTSINIIQVGLTRMLCQPADAMVQEGDFIRALKAASTYQIEGRHLTLNKADGSVVMHLKRD
jgi:heat shock protein HslJ